MQYTVANSKSLCNVTFHCLAGGWQLQAVGATYYIFTVFLNESVTCALEGDNYIQNISFREAYRLIYVRKSRSEVTLFGSAELNF